MRFLRPLLGLSTFLLLVGGPRAAAGPLATDPERFDYLPLPANGLLETRITAASPRFEFKSGLSPFAAFRLPETHGRTLIDVISVLEPPNDPARSRVFYPSLALLSDSFLVVRASEGPSWRFDLPEYAQTIQPGYRVTVEIDEGGPERYLVVYTEFLDDDHSAPGASDQGRLLIRITPRSDE